MKPIDTKELKQLRDEKDSLLLINTLDSENFGDTKIPGSINIPQSQEDFTDKVEDVVSSKARPLVVYCASEDCPSSTHAAKKLDQAGFSQVMDYEAGAKGWLESGEALAS